MANKPRSVSNIRTFGQQTQTQTSINKNVPSNMSNIRTFGQQTQTQTNINKMTGSNVSNLRPNAYQVQTQTQTQTSIGKYMPSNAYDSRTNIHQTQTQTQGQIQKQGIDNRRGMRGASTDDKRISQKIDLIKDVQYFTKNIVIEPVQNNRYNISNKNETNATNYYTKNIRKQKELSMKNGEDSMMGHLLSNMNIITEDMIKNIPGIDENTKFYHKEITITPVRMPPLGYTISKQ